MSRRKVTEKQKQDFAKACAEIDRKTFAETINTMELIAETINTMELIAETIWQSEYVRATGKDRSVSWREGVAESDKDKYRYLAKDIILALPFSK